MSKFGVWYMWCKARMAHVRCARPGNDAECKLNIFFAISYSKASVTLLDTCRLNSLRLIYDLRNRNCALYSCPIGKRTPCTCHIPKWCRTDNNTSCLKLMAHMHSFFLDVILWTLRNFCDLLRIFENRFETPSLRRSRYEMFLLVTCCPDDRFFVALYLVFLSSTVEDYDVWFFYEVHSSLGFLLTDPLADYTRLYPDRYLCPYQSDVLVFVGAFLLCLTYS